MSSCFPDGSACVCVRTSGCVDAKTKFGFNVCACARLSAGARTLVEECVRAVRVRARCVGACTRVRPRPCV
eukprot:6207833-Pleurochrysis_carterae.AAC.2